MDYLTYSDVDRSVSLALVIFSYTIHVRHGELYSFHCRDLLRSTTRSMVVPNTDKFQVFLTQLECSQLGSKSQRNTSIVLYEI